MAEDPRDTDAVSASITAAPLAPSPRECNRRPPGPPGTAEEAGLIAGG
jgi:hypothetical protein